MLTYHSLICQNTQLIVNTYISQMNKSYKHVKLLPRTVFSRTYQFKKHFVTFIKTIHSLSSVLWTLDK